MPIEATDLKFYKPAVVNDTAGNGGRLSATQVVTDVKNNVWPDVPQAERTAGSDKYRKLFAKVANDDDLTLQNPKLFLEKHTPGDDHVTLIAGTFDDTQGDLTGSERRYGTGQLDADVSAGAGSIDVATEGVALALFQAGDTIRISNKDGIGGAGSEEYHVISGAPTYAGDVATITLTGTLANAYLAAATRVASVYEPADVAASVSNWVETSASGTYDEGANPLALDHIGSVTQLWTLTFTSATTFDVTGDLLGAVGSGSTAGDFAPNNPDFSKPYFTLLAAGWGGTWANGETITFRTDPAAVPVWERRVVPAGAASLSGNEVRLAIDGESA